MFYKNRGWNVDAGAGQRGKKIISSLPGNHDLGFGPEIKVSVRQRFEAYFGEGNRVDVIGNHTFVSVDTVSLSAGDSPQRDLAAAKDIYAPADEFLNEVKAIKRKAAARELKFWRGEVEDVVFDHKVEEAENADFSNLPSLDPGENGPDFPTVLLTHVPLYRPPGTPCGPLREHWPPTQPPKGQTTPVVPDDRNAISVSSGYQYQNVLSESDSVKLIKSIGHVIHTFSGDDHDYCEVVHSDEKENVHEITVKSMGMNMGVPTPGFQMVSLYNPIDEEGNSLLGSGEPTLQTHLCLLPTTFSTYTTYMALGIVTVAILVARALLVPILNLQPFALDPVHQSDPILPMYKAKYEDDEPGPDLGSQSSGNAASKFVSARVGRGHRDRSHSMASNGLARSVSPRSKHKAGAGKWGWGENGRGPRIEIRRDLYDNSSKTWGTNWKAATRSNWRTSLQSRTSLVVREVWTTCWRVTWMVLGCFAYLTFKG
jgi:ethanolamine phosphate phosphodiesterase